MKKSKLISKLFVMSALSCLAMSQAWAARVSSVPSVQPACTQDSVTITSIEKSPLDGLGVLYPSSAPAINATSCYGLIDGNQDSVQVGNNIGELNDGLLNGEGNNQVLAMSPTQFITTSQLLDLDGDGVATDPGWIELARGGAGNTLYNTATNAARLTLDIAKLLTFDLSCSNTSSTECSSGTWSLATSLTIIEKVQALLGRNSFDHLAFVLKAGTDWAVYDFDFNLLSAGLGGAFNYETPYSFTGTWNTNDFTNTAGGALNLSHFAVWARDPLTPAGNDVPEPTSLALLTVGLLAMRFGKKA